MSDKFTPELWLTATVSETYAGTEQITSPAARAVVAQAELMRGGVKVLDIGTGLGQVLEAITELKLGNVEIIAGDIDTGLLEVVAAKGWEGVKIEKMDVKALSIQDDHVDYAFGSFLFMLIPNPIDSLKETIRVIKPGGTLGFTTWAHSGPFYLLQEACTLIPSFPNTRTTEMSTRMNANGYWHDRTFIRSTLEGLGMTDIKINALPYVHEAPTAGEMARTLWPVVKMVAMAFGGGEASRIGGWHIFEKVEEVLKLEFGDGPVKVRTVAMVVTATKPE